MCSISHVFSGANKSTETGWLEIISILFRPISLSFRLYGNVFAGENMLETMATMVPGLSWLRLPVSWGDHAPLYYLRTSQAAHPGSEFE